MIEFTPIPGIGLGPFNINMHGLFAAAGVGFGFLLFERKTINKIPESVRFNILLILVVAGVAGARALYVLSNLSTFVAEPLGVLRVWEGGLSYMGSVLLVVPSWYVYTRMENLDFLRFCDWVAVPVVVGHFVGRIGDLLTWDHPGTFTTLPWGVVVGTPQHPAIAYEMLGLLVILSIFRAASERKFFERRFLFLYLGLYGLLRIIVDSFKIEQMLFGFREAQVIGFLFVLVALAGFIVPSPPKHASRRPRV